MTRIRIRIQRCGPGRPRTRPERVAADKGYSSTKIRTYLRRRGIKATIPERIDQINGRLRRGESLCRLDRAAYRRRNVVERCFNKLKHNKALSATGGYPSVAGVEHRHPGAELVEHQQSPAVRDEAPAA